MQMPNTDSHEFGIAEFGGPFGAAFVRAGQPPGSAIFVHGGREMADEFDIGKRSHELCDLITEEGGTVKLNTRAFNKFQHLVWDVWENGYRTGEQAARRPHDGKLTP